MLLGLAETEQSIHTRDEVHRKVKSFDGVSCDLRWIRTVTRWLEHPTSFDQSLDELHIQNPVIGFNIILVEIPCGVPRFRLVFR